MNRDYTQYLTRKNIVFASIGFVVVILGFVFSQYGILIINSDQSASINVSNPNKTYQKTEELSAGSSKVLFLKNDLYAVTLESENNQKSLYQKKVSGFSIANVRVSFLPQQQSVGLGAAEHPCAALDKTTGVSAFYPCPDSGETTPGLLATADGQEFSNIADQLGSRPGKTVPYGEGAFLVAYKDENSSRFFLQKVAASELLGSSEVVDSSQSISPAQLSGSSQIITDTSDARSSRFIFRNNNELFVFKNLEDASPRKIDLSTHLKESSHYFPQAQLVGDNVYVYGGALDSEGDSKTHTSLPQPQKFYVFSVANGKLVREYTVPDNVRVLRYSVSPEGSIAMETHDFNDPGNQFYTILGGKLQSQPLFHYSVGDSCWAGEKLYFIDRDNREVYWFNPDLPASYLAYGTQSNKLSNLECLYGRVYINSHKQTDESQVYPVHVVLNSDPHNNAFKRPDDVFPVEGAGTTIALGDYYKDSVRLVLLGEYDADGSCAPRVGGGKQEAIAYLSSKGLDAAAFSYKVTYQCASATGE